MVAEKASRSSVWQWSHASTFEACGRSALPRLPLWVTARRAGSPAAALANGRRSMRVGGGERLGRASGKTECDEIEDGATFFAKLKAILLG